MGFLFGRGLIHQARAAAQTATPCHGQGRPHGFNRLQLDIRRFRELRLATKIVLLPPVGQRSRCRVRGYDGGRARARWTTQVTPRNKIYLAPRPDIES